MQKGFELATFWGSTFLLKIVKIANFYYSRGSRLNNNVEKNFLIGNIYTIIVEGIARNIF